MAVYTTIDKPSAHFEVDIYAGSSGTTTITGIGFQPDLIITKNRTHDGSIWNVTDSTRGNTKNFSTDNTTAEDTTTRIASFTSDGLTLTGGVEETNTASDYFVQYLWKANGGTTSSNTDGSITSTVQANTTAGFSIVTYTGTGSAATIGHGLGVAPKMILVKKRSDVENTQVYWKDDYQGIDETDYMEMTTTAAQADNVNRWNDTAPTSTVFSVGTHAGVNDSASGTHTYVAYCFAEKTGFSHFGHHYGTAEEPESPFCYCGFRPKFIMIKSNSEAQHWSIIDTERTQVEKDGSAHWAGNQVDNVIYPNNDSDEVTTRGLTLYATGFTIPEAHSEFNSNDYKYVWVAFAAMPIVGSNGIVGTAF